LTLPPFSGLDPDAVLQALDTVGLRGDGRILQLNSYENRVFRVMLEDGSVVVAKFYRPHRWTDEQILEEHAFCRELSQAEVPVVAPLQLTLDDSLASASSRIVGEAATLLHAPHLGDETSTVTGNPSSDWRISVSPWLGGRDPEIESEAAFDRLGRLMGRLHAVGAQNPFQHRIALTAERGVEAVDRLLAFDLLDPHVRPRWESAARRALDQVLEAFSRASDTASIRLHGDAHRGNVIERHETFHLVDLDDTCQGPAVQDLWLFLDGQAGDHRRRQWQALLRGYEDFMDFDDAQTRLIEPLRTLRMLRHAAWIAQRWDDPAFPLAFPGFGTPNYWADHIALLDEQLERMAD
jgi:Ser/Thr protein kinase RdoA (MazF antagonist)